ncbi:polysaccharide pyruvyl transferase [Mycolicibacterium litorale]|uniref:Polysaccharide pyruvyl transferase n=1 Tax=Mycolicibacterium litorale TaxID=758802 RepID=A0A6S6P178_9MYCO|nr:polysaccharide pyruvyl transferase family protein [Mycolicibacterium litorale]BCI51716.1 polysaccharide pyruvyl transferase [Mycolicibacterium litorale]
MHEVFLVNDSRAQNNWGCRATTTALISLIESSGGKVVGAVGHAPHTDFGNGPGVKRLVRNALTHVPGSLQVAHQLKTQREQFLGPSRGFITSLDDFERAAHAIEKGELWPNEGDAVRRAHTVIVNGEGAIYGRQLKGFISLFWAWYAKARHGKRVAFVNHTADLADPQMRRAAEAVYPLLDDVSFRDPISLREAGYAAPQAQSGVVPDAAYTHVPLPFEALRDWAARPGFFSIWPYDADRFDIAQPYIAVTGSSAINRPESADRKAPVRQFTQLCQSLEKTGLPIVLVAPDPTDSELLAPVARSLKLPLIAPSTPLPIAHQVLARAACLLGGRWHPGILAATGGTPLVSLTANTRKTTGLMEQLGLDVTTFDALDLGSSVDVIVEAVTDYVEQGQPLRERIRSRADALRLEARGNVRVLSGTGTEGDSAELSRA